MRIKEPALAIWVYCIGSPAWASDVIARGVSPSVPGAIICRDLQTVNLMIDLYRQHFMETLQDKYTNGDTTLIRGPAEPPPDLALYGCSLIAAGHHLNLERSTASGVAIVSGRLPDGRAVKGVTGIYMLEESGEK